MAAGRLYVVATPIGNLEDMTPRARRVLAEVDLIAAEDTRHSKRLLNHFNIAKPLTSYHEHNERGKAGQLLEKIESGVNIALISDAGMPCVSDPGYHLVALAHARGVTVVPVPGPAAALTALAASGLPGGAFTFHGFFPRKASQVKEALRRLREWESVHIFYESPKRLCATLGLLAEHFPGAPACVARELTKLHEEIRAGSPEELLRHFSSAEVKGECVVLITGGMGGRSKKVWADAEIRAMAERAIQEEGLSRRDAIRLVAEQTGLPRKRVYAAAGGGD